MIPLRRRTTANGATDEAAAQATAGPAPRRGNSPQTPSDDSSREERQSAVEEVAKLLLTQKKYKEAETIRVKPLPIAPYFREWKQETYEEVCAASGRPTEAMKLIRTVEKAGIQFEDVADSGDFDTLDAKLATALTKVLKNNDLKRQVNKAKEVAQLNDEMVKGRQSSS